MASVTPDFNAFALQDVATPPLFSAFSTPVTYSVVSTPNFSTDIPSIYYVAGPITVDVLAQEASGTIKIKSISQEVTGQHQLNYLTQELPVFKVPAVRSFSIGPVQVDLPWLNSGPVLQAFSMEHFEVQSVKITPDLRWPNVADMFDPAKNSSVIISVLQTASSIDLVQPTNYNPNFKSLSNMIFFVQDKNDSLFKYFTLNSNVFGQFTAEGHDHLWIDSEKPGIIHRFKLILHPAGNNL